jgi:pyridoxamine 5'-phosphate oxidase
MEMDLNEMRVHYSSELFDLEHCVENPILQFNQWFNESVNAQIIEPNAMTLATVDVDAKPSARIVLLKDIDDDGFVFYTNYQSKKAEELDVNPNVALVFNWLELMRQVRIEGVVEKISPERSEAYFQSRPLGSQIGAWASPQSQIVSGREELETYEQKILEQFHGKEVLPKPPHWGGYKVKPSYIEFWQGRPNRLHDRIAYELNEMGNWTRVRLAP